MIHVMCGIPGSGKTTLSEQLAKEDNAVLYCYDKMPNFYRYHVCHQTMFNRINRDLRLNKNVVCDDSHITREARMNLLKAISRFECKKILHVMKTPVEVCIQQAIKRQTGKVPAHIVKECYSRYEEPMLEEGWDEIIYHEYVRE
jgi:tRNA uridine 5-carbamoylmethylation protein Kti12